MFQLLAWLHAFQSLIVHWSVAAALIAGAVAVLVLVPGKMAKMAAVAVIVCTVVGIVEYLTGWRDGGAHWKTQLETYIAAEKTISDGEVKRQKDIGAAQIVVLQQQLDAAQSDDDTAAEDIRKLQAALAAKPPVAGRGATREDADALNR